MKIDSSSIAMASANQSVESTKAVKIVKTTVKDTSGTTEASRGDQTGVAASKTAGDDSRLEVSEKARQMMEESNEQAAQKLKSVVRTLGGNQPSFEIEDYEVTLLRRMLELLMGAKIEDTAFKKFKDQQGRGMKEQSGTQMKPQMDGVIQLTPVGQRNISTVSYTSVEVFKSEKVSFQAQGTVKTQDGRTIDLSVVLNISQELYAKYENTVVTNTQLTLYDPLVINFDAATAGVGSQKFEFDLDCDGTSDQVSRLLAGSGFLCLDSYGDGVVHDGSQLFGTQNGDGFKDLAKFDKDGNLWIDENDEIFDKLRIWVKDDNGDDTLFALGELGIGAIYLGNVNTQYTYNQSGDVDGMLRRTGIFLREDGSAGTVQHVDLSI